MSKKSSVPDQDPHWLELRKKITVAKAAEINGMSIATFRKHYGHLIQQLSPRRQGVKLADALDIGKKLD